MRLRAGSMSVAVVFGTLVLALPGRAEIIDYIYQSGADVDSAFSGTIDTVDLTAGGTGGQFSLISPSGAVQIFDATGSAYTAYAGISGPLSFGGGNLTIASSTTGDVFGVAGVGGNLELPVGYTSGSLLSGTEVFSGETLAGVGLTPGTYTYTWGTGVNADSLVVEIGTAPPLATTPEPASFLLLSLGVLGIPLLRKRASFDPWSA